MRKAKITTRVDTSGTSIGRRYARVDEEGCALCITVDHQSVDDNTVTIRERDSTEQKRVPIQNISSVVTQYVKKDLTWESVK